MTTPRDLRLGRARRARQGVVALGVAGVVGTAVALGASTATNDAAATTGGDNGATNTFQGTSPTAPRRPAERQHQAPALGSQGSGGSSHATSSGS